MNRFHIGKDGQPAKCTATKKACPLGGEHFESEAAAYAAVNHAAHQPAASWQPGEITVRPLEPGMIQSGTRAVLPPGRYFLGDPCYTAGKDDTAWQQWVDVAFASGDNASVLGGTYNGHPVIAAGTAYGDGTYMGSDGVNYSVDAGIIGVVPEAVINGMNLTEDDLDGSGSWVTVDKPTALEFDETDGTIFFGPVAIHTGDNPEEEEEEEFYCERCGRHLDNEYDSLCASCSEEDYDEDE